ncbi:MAG: hypothetical protein ACLQVD_16850 [Capsulimonadaceae bacterium]
MTEPQSEDDLDLRQEILYIQERAAAHDPRVVNIGELLLFSTAEGDAWVLDTADRLAMRVAEGGVALPATIDETEDSFAIRWPGRFRLDGAVFIYLGETVGDFQGFRGYPTRQIAAQMKSSAPPLLAADRETLEMLQRMRGKPGR